MKRHGLPRNIPSNIDVTQEYGTRDMDGDVDTEAGNRVTYKSKEF